MAQGDTKTVLIVDDEPDIVEMLVLLVESEGYRAVGVHGGEAAKAALEDCAPDIILLDLMMPDVDGHEVCRHVRAREHLADVLVFMLTAKNEISHIAQALDEGADGFIAKPFDPERLLRFLRFRLTGETTEFYRGESERSSTENAGSRDTRDGERIVFIDLLEPDAEFSTVVGACEGEPHNLLSLWHREGDDDSVETTALILLESSSHFGRLLNRILGSPRVRVLNCSVYREFHDIPSDLM